MIPIVIGPMFFLIIGLFITMFFYSLYAVFKNEEKHLYKFLWTLLILFVPVVGTVVYLIKYIAEGNTPNKLIYPFIPMILLTLYSIYTFKEHISYYGTSQVWKFYFSLIGMILFVSFTGYYAVSSLVFSKKES